MDLQAYLDSGVLELYVLDRLDPAERREVESYARQYPEIAAEIGQVETALEQYARIAGQTTPPAPAVLEQLVGSLRAEQPLPPRHEVQPVDETHKGGLTQWIVIFLAALALAAAAYLYGQLHQERARSEAVTTQLEAELDAVREDCASAAEARAREQRQLANLISPATRNIVLAGTDNAPDARAVVFYNEETNQTLFSAAALPPPPAGKQYQLWAIDAAGPQDLGVLDRDLSAETVLEVPFIPAAAAFAITLEDEGGKPQPDLTALQVIGEVAAG